MAQAGAGTIPPAIRPIYDEVVSVTDAVCEEHLNSEYAALARQMTATLAALRPSPLTTSRPRTWACGIVYALGRVNFLFDKAQTPHLRADALCKLFGISASTGSAKSSEIFDVLDLVQLDPAWTLPSQLAHNPLVWMIQVNGIVIDARHAPPAIQDEAYRSGLIPYRPYLGTADLP